MTRKAADHTRFEELPKHIQHVLRGLVDRYPAVERCGVPGVALVNRGLAERVNERPGRSQFTGLRATERGIHAVRCGRWDCLHLTTTTTTPPAPARQARRG
jgi:hypothetical protein